jgi:cation transport regulator ChaC
MATESPQACSISVAVKWRQPVTSCRHRGRDRRPGGLLGEERLQRMIGVIYRPETERQSHYLTARAADQYDLLVHVETTQALDPIERWSAVEDPADAYASGL